MNLLTTLGFSPSVQGTRVGRPWRQRLEDLLACDVDYRDKTVLDAGCNVGILAYEIAKRGLPSPTPSTAPVACSTRRD